MQSHVNPYMDDGNAEAVLADHVRAAATSRVHGILLGQLAGVAGRGRRAAQRNTMATTPRSVGGAAGAASAGLGGARSALARIDPVVALTVVFGYAYSYNR